jgi:predicted SPOUT superfamily RNA methylase MTH1
LVLLGKKIAVAIPDSVLEEHPAPRDKTVKLGAIARTCAVFGVDEIIILRDPKGRGEGKMMKKVLEYLETPQYLRRRLFGFDEALRYAGLLPPLRIPSHKPKVPVNKLKEGEFREGVVLADGTVDIGLDKRLVLNERKAEYARVTVRITGNSPLSGELVARGAPAEYWGYTVEVMAVEDLILDARYDVKIATSRYGNNLTSILNELRDSVMKTRSTMLMFGSPSRGLFDIVGSELPKRVSFVVNLFPEQHVETVRTEEAISAGLYFLNLVLM